MVKDYRGDKLHQRKIWVPVDLKIKRWQHYHAQRNKSGLHSPLLFYRDGGNFLLIRQELPDGKVLHHKLKGASRKIFLSCTRIRSTSELLQNFPGIPPDRIVSFLADLRKKRLLFSEKDRHLSLAVHLRDY